VRHGSTERVPAARWALSRREEEKKRGPRRGRREEGWAKKGEKRRRVGQEGEKKV
jgi:hypothetical protein